MLDSLIDRRFGPGARVGPQSIPIQTRLCSKGSFHYSSTPLLHFLN
jgi:hypothetical protein